MFFYGHVSRVFLSVRLDFISRCMDDRLTPFYSKALEFNAHIRHITDPSEDFPSPLSHQRYIPYAGNGYFGIEIGKDAPFFIKYGRHLSQPIDYQPIVDFRFSDFVGEDSIEEPYGKQSVVVDYVNGVVHKFQCFGSDFFISHDFYGKIAHFYFKSNPFEFPFYFSTSCHTTSVHTGG